MLRRSFRGGARDGNNRNNNGGGPSSPTTTTLSSEEDLLFARQTSQLIPAEVRMISGCHSEQTSADVSSTSNQLLPNPGGKSGGACTSALLDILYRHHHNQVQQQQKHNEHQRNNGKKATITKATTTMTTTSTLTFQQVLLELRDLLSKRGYDQIPQLTSSRSLELQQTPLFSMRNDRNGDRDTTSSGGICRALLVGINYYGQSGQLVS